MSTPIPAMFRLSRSLADFVRPDRAPNCPTNWDALRLRQWAWRDVTHDAGERPEPDNREYRHGM